MMYLRVFKKAMKKSINKKGKVNFRIFESKNWMTHNMK